MQMNLNIIINPQSSALAFIHGHSDFLHDFLNSFHKL